MEMIPLYKPYMPKELPELDSILHSDALAYGKWGRLFEEKLTEFIGNKLITVVNSYNSAMLVALTVIGIKPGDEIIASPMSCLASNQPFATQGTKVVWADIDPSTGTLSPDSIRSKITSKTKAIFHNHFCGYVGYIDEINAIGKENGIIVIDDAIEAFGSEYKGRMIGNAGTDLTVFSFQTVRLPNTVDGGAIAFNNNELYQKALLIRDYGIDRRDFRNSDGEINSTCDISIPGYGATLNEICSYIGCMQLEHVNKLISLQRNNAEKWKNKIQIEYPTFKLLGTRKEQKPNYWIFGILTSDKVKLLKHFRDKGYYASSVHLPNNFYSVFENICELSGVTEFYSKFLALPCGWWFSKIDTF